MELQMLLPSPLVVVFVVGITTICYYLHKHRNIPPGPRGLPFLGYAPFFGPHPQNTFLELGKKYGSLFSMYMGPQLTIVLNDYESIKAAFLGQADIFAGRADGFIFRHLTMREDGKIHGVGVIEGEPWKKTRRFTLQTFRDLGMGKAKLQDRILEEAEYLTDIFSRNVGKPFDPTRAVTGSVANVVGTLCFGKVMQRDEPKFKELLVDTVAIAHLLAQAGPMQAYPILRFLPGQRSKWIDYVTRVNRGQKYFSEMIQKHKETFDENEIRDYIDAALRQQRKENDSGESSESVVLDYDINANLGAFFGAGTETTTMTLLWLYLFMLHYPDVQEKVHKEIDQQVDPGRPISVEEKHNLPYTEAVIREAQRLGNVTPFGLLRSNVEETTLLGYRIPKRSFIMPNFLAVNRDPVLWENPSAFKPERFLDSDGKVTEPPQFMPFSIGKRACVGESLARMEIFLFFSNVMQKFTLRPSPDLPIPSLDQYTTGISCRPLPYHMVLTQREAP